MFFGQTLVALFLFTTIYCSCGTSGKNPLGLVALPLLWKSDSISSLSLSPAISVDCSVDAIVVRTSLSNCNKAVQNARLPPVFCSVFPVSFSLTTQYPFSSSYRSPISSQTNSPSLIGEHNKAGRSFSCMSLPFFLWWQVLLMLEHFDGCAYLRNWLKRSRQVFPALLDNLKFQRYL